jgi:2,3-bisphosphoglycerate-independent phosphoglycerate mutase
MPGMDFFKPLKREADTRILLLVADGLGGLPRGRGGLTELETARTPNLDELAAEGICGLLDPISPGITPGSGPAHLSLFGYDPIEYNVGRGLLEALGVDFPIEPGDVAARINFCTVDDEGKVTDRRAGRISTPTNAGLVEKLRSNVKIDGVEVFVETVKEHRAVVVFRGDDLYDALNDTDPQVTGEKPHPIAAEDEQSKKMQLIATEFVSRSAKALAKEYPANMVLLRGFARHEQFPSMKEVFGIKAGAVAAYPMYKGVAELVGMNVIDCGQEPEEELEALSENVGNYDFFFFHYKKTDSRGEDGDFDAKVKEIEHLDLLVPAMRKLNFDVIAVTGDHSTPSVLKAHSWHPSPLILWATHERGDACNGFGETQCALQGGLGRLPATCLMPMMLANAGRLEKFGA